MSAPTVEAVTAALGAVRERGRHVPGGERMVLDIIEQTAAPR